MKNLLKLLHDFKSSFLFLAKFLLIYVVLNIAYGLYIESFGDKADEITGWVAQQTVSFLNANGYDTSTRDNYDEATFSLINENKSIIRVFEGCNGINTMIIFMAFIIAFPGNWRKMLWFIPLGFLVIHITNIGRLSLLFWVALNKPDYMFFTHKYLFTAIIYGVIFLLWVIWVVKFSGLTLKREKI